MTHLDYPWNESGQSEAPAVEVLEKLGYTYIPADTLAPERESLRDAVLARRLSASLKRLNPWLSDDNVHKAVRVVSQPSGDGDSSRRTRRLYTALTYGISLEQDRGGGKKSHDVRFFDFENPENNDFVVTRQFVVQGAKKHIRPDVVAFRQRRPSGHPGVQEPDAGRGLASEEAVDQFRALPGARRERYRDLGAPRLFHTVQIANRHLRPSGGATARLARPDRFYCRWKTLMPLAEEDA